MPNWADQNQPFPPPTPNEYGLYVRPIFSGSDPNVLTVSLSSGAINLGNISGTFSQPQPSSAGLSPVPCSTSAVIIASGNMARMGLTIFNDCSGTLFLRLGLAVATNMFTVKLSPQDFYELPYPVYTGVITGLWGSPDTGFAYVTESTP